jgi:two-component system chemotaxis sensor kinase CheA
MWRKDRELLEDFVAETRELVDAIERDLLELERRPGTHKGTIDAIFRAAHSIKGNAGLFEADGVMVLAHAMETVLGRMRKGELVPDAQVVSTLLSANQRFGAMLSDLDHASVHDLGDVLSALQELERPRTSVSRCTLEPPSTTSRPPLATMRVPIARLDALHGAAQDLATANRSLREEARAGDLDAVARMAAELESIAERIERGIAALRVMPVGSVFGRYRRVARDLSLVLQKELDLRIVGEDVEVEKPVLEVLADPIGHLVRNAIDHGIEEPHVRRSAGKPARGLVEIRASLDDRGLLVEVSDDGRGIDPRRVAQSALEKGLIDAERLSSVSDDQLLALIFEPGFSTAAEVTDVSGRGVGMDVVRECIHRVGGAIDVRSALGVGTTVSLRVPAHL